MDQGCGILLPATSVHGPRNRSATFLKLKKMEVGAYNPYYGFGQFVYENWEAIQESNRKLGRYIRRGIDNALSGSSKKKGGKKKQPKLPYKKKKKRRERPEAEAESAEGPASKKSRMAKATIRGHDGYRVTKTKRGKTKRKTKSLKKRVSALERNITHAVYDYRSYDDLYVANAINQCAYGQQTVFSNGLIEGGMNAIPSVDAGAAVNIDPTDNTKNFKSLKMLITDIYVEMVLRNNSLNPVHLDYYLIRCTEKTNDTFATQATAIDQENLISNDWSTNFLTFPSDLVKNSWKIVKHTKKYLNPGDELHEYYTRKSFKYDPETYDNDATTFSQGDLACLVRIEGAVCHDATTPSTIGKSDGSVDVVFKRKWRYKWNAELPFHRIETVNSLGAVATANTAVRQVEHN